MTLDEDDFRDWAHSSRAGAERVSERVIHFLIETNRDRRN